MDDLSQLNLSDPVVIKGLVGSGLYAFAGSRFVRMAGLALAAWAGYEYFTRKAAPASTAATAPARRGLVMIEPPALPWETGGNLQVPDPYTPLRNLFPEATPPPGQYIG